MLSALIRRTFLLLASGCSVFDVCVHFGVHQSLIWIDMRTKNVHVRERGIDQSAIAINCLLLCLWLLLVVGSQFHQLSSIRINPF